ncbi:probable F-box protein At4g22165 [Phoenix dactylifera]|uniref:Probable F-box protein At4g22165 n=1 Tax=Phoenix dactylifera TaxID=42345 RepID=A0A8B7D0Z9_PHODC|nr:probable F-box protein At4g22165 [Phoenix dactylifera]
MSTSAKRNWADLPLDLLGDIASRLTLRDYRRFCRVCTSWASVKSPYTLYLLLPGDDGEYQNLLRATDHTSLPAPALPALRGRWCVGSQDDWLSTLDEFSQLSLLNLITREEIKLPSIAPLPQIDAFSKVVCGRQYWSRIFFPPEDFRLLASVSKVVFSPNPSPASYTAVAFLDYPAKFLYTRAGDDKWTAAEELDRAKDVIYRDGRFLAVFGNGEAVAVDLGADSRPSAFLASRAADSLFSVKYLVDSAGDLLQVRRYLRRTTVGDENRIVIKTTRIQVFKCDVKRRVWVPVESLGDRSLLVGTCCSVSFSAQEIPGLKGNRVYFTEDYWVFLHAGAVRDAQYDVGVFRLEDGSLEPCLPIPSPKPNFGPPIWVILPPALLDVGVDCKI